MGLLGSLAMLLSFLWIAWSPGFGAQLSGASIIRARSLDTLLQDYAYRAFVRPRTGIPYDGNPPSNLTGISISVMRLKSGSLRNRGVKSYKKFMIPTGVVVRPYVERLVLVYQNLGNWSTVYYPLHGYIYLAPVVGLLGYSASNLSATSLPELDVRASGQPILIRFSGVKSVAGARCVTFDLQGMMKFNNVSSGNVCSTVEQGHFAIVVESPAPSPAPVLPSTPPAPSKRGGKNERKVWKIVGSVIGGLIVLIVMALLILWIRRFKHRKKMQRMERAADVGEALQSATVGNTRAPVATVTRTQPVLENEYVP
ncbi:uncharacterized protein LOC122092475 [Macadamia integrifolia]|uniref:uncharacterized protein LOC122092475 n=1 Tax=Macadamia integrifolia TaxID=60698 RepID=UPI001C5302CB|nr:uncharacterized protein LOC122092475 [Macadamia integrifolia]